MVAVGEANVYDSVEQAKRMEPKHILARNAVPEKKPEEPKAPKEEVPEKAPEESPRKRSATKKVLLIAFVVVVLALAAAVGFAGGQDDGETASAEGGPELRIYVGAYTPRERTQSDRWDPASYMDQLIADYQGQNSDVSFEVLPDSRSAPGSRPGRSRPGRT